MRLLKSLGVIVFWIIYMCIVLLLPSKVILCILTVILFVVIFLYAYLILFKPKKPNSNPPSKG
jgi:hypothetical protein